MAGLTVYLNRGGINTVETDQSRVRATRQVDISIENHGKPTHVHLHADDDLATLSTLEDPHVFVPNGEWREVGLKLSAPAEGKGRLEITAGYGKERETVDIEVEAPEGVDEESTGAAAKIDTVGGEPTSTDSEPGPSWLEERVGDVIDPDRLRNPVVLGAFGAFLVVLLALLVIDPLFAVAAALGALLVAIAIVSYLRAEADSESDTDES